MKTKYKGGRYVSNKRWMLIPRGRYINANKNWTRCGYGIGM